LFADELQRDYVNNFFIGAGRSNATISILEFLLKSTTLFERFDTIVLSGDSGSGFRQTETLYFYSTIWEKYGKKVSVELLAPGHAWNMCDSHGGPLADMFVPINLAGDLITPEDACWAVEDSSLKNTTAYAHENPHERDINEDHCKVAKIMDFVSFRFSYNGADGKEMRTAGVCVAQQLSGSGRQQLFDMRSSERSAKRCSACQSNFQRPVFSHVEGEECPTEEARRGYIDPSVKEGEPAGVRNVSAAGRKRKPTSSSTQAPRKKRTKPGKPVPSSEECKENAEEPASPKQPTQPVEVGEMLLIAYDGVKCLVEALGMVGEDQFDAQFWGRTTGKSANRRFYPSWTDEDNEEQFMTDKKREELFEAQEHFNEEYLQITAPLAPLSFNDIVKRHFAYGIVIRVSVTQIL
jgi:hypothetical protein